MAGSSHSEDVCIKITMINIPLLWPRTIIVYSDPDHGMELPKDSLDPGLDHPRGCRNTLNCYTIKLKEKK